MTLGTRPSPTGTLSAECTLALRPDYPDMHSRCSRTRDIPLPHSHGILLVHRCGCSCHARAGGIR
ncbi:hypothetical protein RKD49_003576 [Streptomyces glaucescens]